MSGASQASYERVHSRLFAAAEGGVRYAPLQLLGAGGLGVVHAAADTELNRTVAVKRVRCCTQDGARSLARGMREAAMLAALRHPNIVEVYDVFTDGSEVCIVMELVEGVTVGRWLAARSRSASQILRVFRQAGEGIAAAHARRVVHRDFKPANVMIGADSRVRVLDFGLARSLAEETVSSCGTLAAVSDETSRFGGTRRYAAPEQRRGEVTLASDQFSFCLSLYESLRGHPFVEADPCRGRLEHNTKPWLPGVSRRVRNAIERGLNVDPSRRWPSMRRLLAELSPKPRAHPALAAVVMALGGAAAFVAAPNAQGEATAPPPAAVSTPIEDAVPLARARAALAQSEASHAAGRYDAALSMATVAAERAEALQRPRLVGQALMRRGLALGELGRYAEEEGVLVEATWTAMAVGDDETVADAATALVWNLGAEQRRFEDAALWVRHARAAVDRLGQEGRQAAELHNTLGTVAVRAGRYEQSVGEFERALEIEKKTEGLEVAAIITALNFGGALQRIGEHERARAVLEEAIASGRDVLGPTHPRIGAMLSNLGGVHVRTGDDERATARFKEALGIYEAAYGLDHPRVAAVVTNLAQIAVRAGEHDTGLAGFLRARKILTEAHGRDSVQVARLHNLVGVTLRRMGRLPEAEAAFLESTAILEVQAGWDHESLASPLKNLADLHLEDGNHEAARPLLERVRAIEAKQRD